MPSKPLELPPEVAKAFVADMRAFHAEKSPINRGEIASRQIYVLRQYQGKDERPSCIATNFELSDVAGMIMDDRFSQERIGVLPGLQLSPSFRVP
jgi:hypothetical protein